MTIIVSALYQIETVAYRLNTTLILMDGLNFTLDSLRSSDHYAGATAGLVLFENLTSPRWTYDNMVFTVFTAATKVGEGALLRSRILAVRPEVTCDAVDTPTAGGFSITSGQSRAADGYEARVNFETNISWPCEMYSDSTHLSGQFAVPIDGIQTLIGDGQPSQWSSESNEDITLIGGCPVLEFYLSTAIAGWNDNAVRGNTTLAEMADYVSIDFNITHFLCCERIQNVMVDVTFELPDLDISSTFPPRPDESTAIYLEWSNRNYTGTIYRDALDTLLVNLPDSFRHDERYLAPIARALIRNKWGYHADELVGPEGHDKVTASANAMLSTYMALAINSNFRQQREASTDNIYEPLSSSQPSGYEAEATPPPRLRLKQDKAAKSALQGILLLMVCCAVGSYAAIRTKDMLPENPASIAGIMSLLAGSEIVTREIIPEG